LTVEIAMLHRVLPADRIPDGPERRRTLTPDLLEAFLEERSDHARPSPAELLDLPADRPRLLVTCDGGTVDFAEQVLPVLERHGVHAVLFVVSDWARGVGEPLDLSLWRALSRRQRIEVPGRGTLPLRGEAERLAALDALLRICEPLAPAERDGLVAALGADPGDPPGGRFAGPEQIRDLARHPLVTIGVAGRSHSYLPALRAERLAAEVAGSRREVEHWVGERVEWFAYPYGAHDAAVRRCVASAGFRFACAGPAGPRSVARLDPLALPRFELGAAAVLAGRA
jgi:peptidoglycan/xylan/chitin deacetylase (PgdA/CDA1 family)